MSKIYTAQYSMPQRMIDASICAYSVTIEGTFKPDNLYFKPIGLEANLNKSRRGGGVSVKL